MIYKAILVSTQLRPGQARFLLPLTSAKTNTSGNRDRDIRAELGRRIFVST